MTPAADLEALWYAHHESLMRYVARRFRAEDIEDLVQDVYLLALEAMRRGNGYNSHASGWLYRIAHNAIIDRYRYRSRRPEALELDALYDDEESARPRPNDEAMAVAAPELHDLVMQQLTSEQVRLAVARLTPLQAHSITLRLAGYQNGEIAELVGSDERAIKQVNTRAYAQLRVWLQDVAPHAAADAKKQG